MKYLIIFALFVGFVVAIAVATKPIGEAKAYQMRATTDLELRHRQDNHEYWLSVGERLAPWMAVTVIVIMLSVGALVVSGAAGGSIYVIGVARTGVAASNVKARTIPLDRATRQFPLVVDNPHNPRFLINPNAGQVLRLTTETRPIAQMIAASGYVQAAGAIAQEKSPIMADIPIIAGQLTDNGQATATAD